MKLRFMGVILGSISFLNLTVNMLYLHQLATERNFKVSTVYFLNDDDDKDDYDDDLTLIKYNFFCFNLF